MVKASELAPVPNAVEAPTNAAVSLQFENIFSLNIELFFFNIQIF